MEIRFYNEALSETGDADGKNIEAIECDIANKWGIAVEHCSDATTPTAACPADVDGCAMWLDGSDESTMYQYSTFPYDPDATEPGTLAVTGVASGDGVMLWKDKSANGNDAYAIGANRQPKYYSSLAAANATLPAVEGIYFDNGSNTTNSDSSDDYFRTKLDLNSGNYTIFVVSSTVSFSTRNFVLTGSLASSNNNLSLLYSPFQGHNLEVAGVGSSNDPEAKAIAGEKYINTVVANLSNRTASHYLNGDVIKNISTIATTTATPRYLVIGNKATLDLTLPQSNIGVMEVIAYDKVLSQDEKEEIECYLGTKWGVFVPSCHVSSSPTTNITAATKTNPVQITSTAHGFSNGNTVFISGVKGMPELNHNTYTVANAAANTFELSGIDGTAYGTYTSGGYVQKTANITSISKPVSPAAGIVTAPAHGFLNDECVIINGVPAMSQIRGRTYIVASATADTFTLKSTNGISPIVTANYTTATLGGIARKVPCPSATSCPEGTTGCILWVDADDISTVIGTDGSAVSADGSTVAMVTDKSGVTTKDAMGYDWPHYMWTADTARRPTYEETPIKAGGTASGVLRFEAANDGFRSIAHICNAALNAVTTGGVGCTGTLMPYSVFMVYAPYTNVASYAWQSSFYLRLGGANLASSWASLTTSTVGVEPANGQLYSATHSGSVLSQKVNGTALTNVAAAQSQTDYNYVPNYMVFGKEGQVGVYRSATNYQSDIGEVVIYNTDVSADRAKIECYLANKWGLCTILPAGHCTGVNSDAYCCGVDGPPDANANC
jgi:hypothetical protein